MNKWKLYWVTSDGLEDCFVVAKNSRSAKRIEKDANGFEDQEVTNMKCWLIVNFEIGQKNMIIINI